MAELQFTCEAPEAPQDYIAHYRFEGNLRSTPYNTSLTGVPFDVPTYGVGQVGQCITFDGTTQYATLTGTNTFTLPPFSISVWAKSGQATWNSQNTIVSKKDNWILGSVGGSREVRFLVRQQGGIYAQVSTTPSDIEVYHHYGFTYDGSTIYGYCDGVLEGTTSATSMTGSPVQPIHLGRDTTAETFLNGSVDELYYYNRTLTTTEWWLLFVYGRSVVRHTEVTVAASFAHTAQLTVSGTISATAAASIVHTGELTLAMTMAATLIGVVDQVTPIGGVEPARGFTWVDSL